MDSKMRKTAKPETINHAVQWLNEALEADREAIQHLFDLKVSCNAALASHPTFQIQVGPDGHWITPIGLVNGILGIREDGWGYVAIVYDLKCPKHGTTKYTIGKVLGDICDFPDTPVKAARGCLNRIVLGDVVRFEKVQR